MHTSDSSESANSSDGFLMSNATEVETVETAKKIEHAPINFTCLARKKNKFDLNIFDFNYRFGSITLTPTLVQILTSQRRFPNREPVELILWKDKIFDVSLDKKRVTFTVKDEGEYVLNFRDLNQSKSVFDAVVGNTSIAAMQIESELDKVFSLIYSEDSTAWVTSFIVAVCTSIFVLMCFQGYGVFSPDGFMAIQWGSKFSPLIYDGEYWRLLTSGFMHFGFVHLALNMYLLYQVGAYFERIFGSLYFLSLYIFCLIFASIVSTWWGPGNNSVGASGAIFGIFSAVTTYAFLAKNKLPKSLSSVMIKEGLIFFAINLSLGAAISLIDNAAHLGGLIGGVIFGYIFSRPITSERSQNISANLLVRVVVSCLVLLATWSLLIGQNEGYKNKLEEPRRLYYLDLGRHYYADNKFEEALRNFHIASDLGDKTAPGILGLLYGDEKLEAIKNPIKSLYWNDIGMQRGSGSAAFNLGVAYEYGKGVEKNELKAYDLYGKSAELGSIHGQYFHIETLLAGIHGVKRDEDAAIKYLRLLSANKSGVKFVQEKANGKNALGIFILGKFYQLGFAFEMDQQLAYKYFWEAAQQNYGLAEYEVGLAFLNGKGASVDVLQAKKWLSRSAEHGFEPAKSILENNPIFKDQNVHRN